MNHFCLPDLIWKLQQKNNAQNRKSRPEDTKEPGSEHGYGSKPQEYNTSKWKAAEQKDVPDLTTIQRMNGNQVEQIQAEKHEAELTAESELRKHGMHKHE